ncbi:hypothetical protein JCM10212_000049 [Sporobolomyces blumeae]
MPFQQSLVPSPTLSSSPKSPSTAARPSTSSSSSAPPLNPSGPVGLGVLGAGDLDGSQGTDESLAANQVTSPIELTQFVDTLLNDLEARFDTLSSDVLTRLSSLSTRVDSLETSLADLMSGTPTTDSAGSSTATA